MRTGENDIITFAGLMVKRPVVLEVHSYNFYCRFSENDCSVEAVAIFLFLAIKSTLITVPCNEKVPRLYNNSDAIFRLLISDYINPNPGPVSAATAGKINCRVMNARSLKSYHKDSTTNWQSVCKLHRFQNLVYAENYDVICVNETWLNQNISNSKILHSGFTILRRDRSDRGGGGVLIAIKTASFKAVKEFKPEPEAELQQLEIIFAEITTLNGQMILFCFCYRPLNEDPSWMDIFNNFLHEVCDQFNNMVISGDFNLPDILWDSIDSASGVNELAFIETLHDHLLICATQQKTHSWQQHT